jgi:hypothetical protein
MKSLIITNAAAAGCGVVCVCVCVYLSIAAAFPVSEFQFIQYSVSRDYCTRLVSAVFLRTFLSYLFFFFSQHNLSQQQQR